LTRAVEESFDIGNDSYPEFTEALLEPGLESGEITLILLAKIGLVRGIHEIKPVYQLIGDFISQLLVHGT
jgi:hypothetical protein